MLDFSLIFSIYYQQNVIFFCWLRKNWPLLRIYTNIEFVLFVWINSTSYFEFVFVFAFVCFFSSRLYRMSEWIIIFDWLLALRFSSSANVANLHFFLRNFFHFFSRQNQWKFFSEFLQRKFSSNHFGIENAFLSDVLHRKVQTLVISYISVEDKKPFGKGKIQCSTSR